VDILAKGRKKENGGAKRKQDKQEKNRERKR